MASAVSNLASLVDDELAAILYHAYKARQRRLVVCSLMHIFPLPEGHLG